MLRGARSVRPFASIAVTALHASLRHHTQEQVMTNKVSIRVCVPGDESSLSLVGQAAFLESFAGLLDGKDIMIHCANQHSAAVYRAWLDQPNVHSWIAEIQPGRAPIGYAVLAPPQLPVADPRDDDLEIKRIYLLHRFQGSGTGRRLMDAAMAHAKKKNCSRLLLGVHSRNTGAIAFYRKLGFDNAGKRSFKVGNTFYDDIVLARDL